MESGVIPVAHAAAIEAEEANVEAAGVVLHLPSAQILTTLAKHGSAFSQWS